MAEKIRGFGGLAVRALARNARGVWFDSHPKLNFSGIFRCLEKNFLFIMLLFYCFHVMLISYLFREHVPQKLIQ